MVADEELLPVPAIVDLDLLERDLELVRAAAIPGVAPTRGIDRSARACRRAPAGGTDPLAWARGRSPDEIVALGLELIGTLGRVHDLGLVFGGVGASGVRIVEGRPVVVDLVRLSEEPAFIDGGAAPEALAGARVDRRLDLHGAGTLIGAMLALADPAPREELVRAVSSLAAADPHVRPSDANVARSLVAAAAGIAPRDEPVATTARAQPGPLVGRTARLEEVLEAVRGGLATPSAREAPGIVLVEASAGLGRTRFLDEILVRLAAEGVAVARASGARSGPRPFGALAELLRRLAAGATSASSRTRATLDRLAVELDAPLAANPGSDEAPLARTATPETAEEAREARLQLADAIASAVLELGRGGPLVLALDDLDRADAGTRLVARHLARRLGAARRFARDASLPGSDEVSAEGLVAPSCIVVATHGSRLAGTVGEPGQEDASQPIAMDMASLAAEPFALSVRLEPLGEDALATIAASLMGEPPSSPRARELARAARGTPALLVDALRSGVRASSPEELVKDRLDARTGEERALLHALAAIGREADLALVAEVAGLAPGAARAALARLTRDELVRRGPAGHSLRVPLYDVLAAAASERFAALGRALAGRLESAAGTARELAAIEAAEWAVFARDSALLEKAAPLALEALERLGAHHRSARISLAHADAALALGDLARAVERLVRAGDAFLRAGTTALAQDALVRATREGAPVAPELRARAWRKLGVVRATLGSGDGARASFRRARAALARREGPVAALERARTFLADAEASLAQGDLDLATERGEHGLRALRERGSGPPGSADEDASGEAGPLPGPPSPPTPPPPEAPEGFAEDAARTRARLLALLGHVALLRDRPREAETLLRASLAIDERHRNLATAARTQQRLGGVALALGDVEGAQAHWRASLAVRERIGDRAGIAHLHANLSLAAARAGELARARALLRRSLRIREELGDRRGRAASLHNLGYVAACQGELHAAVEALEECLRVREELGDRWYASSARNNLGQVLLDLGRTVEAEEHLEAALEARRALGDRAGEAASLANLCDLALRRGDFALAIEREALSRHLRESLDSPEDSIDGLRRGARIEVALGNLDVAIEAARRAVKLAKQSALPLQEPSSRLLLAEALARGGKLDKAKRELERARSTSERAGDRLTARRAEVELAAMLVARGFPDDARALLDSRPVPFVGPRRGYSQGVEEARPLEAQGPLRVRERLLRARIELARKGGQPALARRFAEEALEAARAGAERELEWRALQAAAAAAELEGDETAALELGAEAQEIVEALLANVPEPRRETYLRADPARAAALRGDAAYPTLVPPQGAQTPAPVRPRVDLRGAGTDDDAPTRPTGPPPPSRRKKGTTDAIRRSSLTKAGLAKAGKDAPAQPAPPSSSDVARADFAAILGLNRRIVDERDVNKLFPALVDAAARLCGAERAFLAFFGEKEDEVQVLAARGVEPDELLGSRQRFSRNVARKAAETGEPVVTADAVREGGAKRTGVIGLGLRSVLAAPVRAPDGRRGALYLDHRFQIGIFGARELKLVEALADQCALAVGRQALEQAIVRTRGVAPGEAQRELLRAEVRGLVKPTVEPVRFHGLVGLSTPLRRLVARLAELARGDAPVLLVGPRGVGKEHAARSLHAASKRAAGPFVVLDLRDATSAADLETALAGGPDAVVPGGAVGAARGGTLLLKAIDGGALGVQRALAAALGRIPRGSEGPRLVATAASDEAILADLLSALGAALVPVPSLADRREDVPELASSVLAGLARERGETKTLSVAARDALVARPLAGEAREVVATLVAAWARAGARAEIQPDDLPPPPRAKARPR